MWQKQSFKLLTRHSKKLEHEIIQLTGISTVNTLTLLGIKICSTLHQSILSTFAHIDVKAMARTLRIAAKHAHLIHKRLLIQAALAPMYSHAFMALGSTEAVNKVLAEAIREGMWAKAENGKGRRQVAFEHIFGGYEEGGLNISHPAQVNEGLMLNTLDRIFAKIDEFAGEEGTAPNIVRVLQGIIEAESCPDLREARQFGGTLVWKVFGARISHHNKYLGTAFHAMSRLHGKLETRKETWYCAPFWGHTKANPIFPIRQDDARTLRQHGLYTVSKIFDTQEGTQIHSHLPIIAQPAGIPAAIWDRIVMMHQGFRRDRVWRDGQVCTDTNIHYVRRTCTYSHVNRKLYKEEMFLRMTAPPSYFTRIRDRLPLPSKDDYCKAYSIIMRAVRASTIAISFSFSILNRTVWTAQKQYLSGNAGGRQEGVEQQQDSGLCLLCNVREDTAHIIVNCDAYSYRLWELLNQALTTTMRIDDPTRRRIELNFCNIMYHTRIQNLDPQHHKNITALLLEIKRDIYVRRTARYSTPHVHGRIYDDQRIKMHISIACSRLIHVIESKGKDAGIVHTLQEVCLG